MTYERTDILLVEDNPSDVKLTLHALKSANLANKIHVARDGVEAIEFLFGNGSDRDAVLPMPKLILLDLKLPRLDGHEVLKRVKGDSRTSGIPIVVLTSSSEERDVMRTYEGGANSYIIKPVDFEQFTEAVRDIGKYWLVINRFSVHTGGEARVREQEPSQTGQNRGCEKERCPAAQPLRVEHAVHDDEPGGDPDQAYENMQHRKGVYRHTQNHE